MLLYPDQRPFAIGASSITFRPATERESTPRIFVRVSFGGVETQAFVDTGAPHPVVHPEIANLLDLDPDSALSHERYQIRRDFVDGHLHRLQITLVAEAGDNLDVEATVFVPEIRPDQDWSDFPSILGLRVFLEQIRFAIDPSEDRFYFGADEVIDLVDE